MAAVTVAVESLLRGDVVPMTEAYILEIEGGLGGLVGHSKLSPLNSAYR